MKENIHKEKILELLYSGEYENDLLAFEKIKQLEDSGAYKFPLMGLLTCKNLLGTELRNQVYEYLESSFDEKQKDFIRNTSSLRLNKLTEEYDKDFEQIFSIDEISNLLYFLVKREEIAPDAYLAFPNKGHSKRAEIMDLWHDSIYVKDGMRVFKALNFSVLYPDEMDRCLKSRVQYIQSILNKVSLPDRKLPAFDFSPSFEFRLDVMVSDELPLSILDIERVASVKIYEGFKGVKGISRLPKFLFLFKNVSTLNLQLSNKFELPTDWSRSYGFKKLILENVENCNISDLSFLTTIPKLKEVDIKDNGIVFSHPGIFLQARGIQINVNEGHRNHHVPMTLKFLSTEGYSISSPLKRRWIKVAYALKMSNISHQNQIKYLKKVSAFEEPIETNLFSIDELKELVRGKAIYLRKGYQSNLIKACWANLTPDQPQKYGEEFLEMLIQQRTNSPIAVVEENSQTEKILNLLHTKEPANDLLSFEIIKQLEDSSAFKIPLMGLLLCETLKKTSMKNEILEYLKPTLTANQKRFLSNASSRNLNKVRGRYNRNFEKYFSITEISNILYFLVHRDKVSPDVYLAFPNKEHSKREEMVDLLIENRFVKKANHRSRVFNEFNFSFLYPNEMEKFLNRALFHFQKNPNLKDVTFRFDFDLNLLKTQEIPSTILNLKKVDLKIYDSSKYTRGIRYFPKFIFSFKNVSTLTLNLFDESELPNDWSSAYGWEKMILKYSEKCTISDFNFLATIPKLERVEITSKHFRFSHPEIFLQAKHVYIDVISNRRSMDTTETSQIFSSTEGYALHSKLNLRSFLRITNALKKSDLSYQNQIKFLKMVNASEHSYDELKTFSFDKILELFEGKAIRLIKNRRTNEISIDWGYTPNRSNGAELLNQLKEQKRTA